MSLVLYTHASINLDTNNLELPDETVYITKNNINMLDALKIQELPAIVKTVGAHFEVFQGLDVYNVPEISAEERAHHMEYTRKNEF